MMVSVCVCPSVVVEFMTCVVILMKCVCVYVHVYFLFKGTHTSCHPLLSLSLSFSSSAPVLMLRYSVSQCHTLMKGVSHSLGLRNKYQNVLPSSCKRLDRYCILYCSSYYDPLSLSLQREPKEPIILYDPTLPPDAYYDYPSGSGHYPSSHGHYGGGGGGGGRRGGRGGGRGVRRGREEMRQLYFQ